MSMQSNTVDIGMYHFENIYNHRVHDVYSFLE